MVYAPHLAAQSGASQYVAMVSATPLVAAENIGRRRPNSHAWLLENVSVAVRAGECVVLVGPSGVGKTLLLRALAALDPHDQGDVRWHGQSVPSRQIPAFRRHVMYLSQRPALVAGTVEDNLRLPYSLNAHRDHAYDPARVCDLLASLGRTDDFLAADRRHLSGGEAQITALVRAIALDPEVILLDEPTASLDRQTAQAAESLIDQWIGREPNRRAAIWASHDPRQTERVAGRRIEMIAGGRIDHTGAA